MPVPSSFVHLVITKDELLFLPDEYEKMVEISLLTGTLFGFFPLLQQLLLLCIHHGVLLYAC